MKDLTIGIIWTSGIILCGFLLGTAGVLASIIATAIALCIIRRTL